MTFLGQQVVHHAKAGLHLPLPPHWGTGHALHDLQWRSIEKATDLATCADEQAEFLELMSSGDSEKMVAATRQLELCADLMGVEAVEHVYEMLFQVLPPCVKCMCTIQQVT